jgi:catechol 2,3-dioxygenase-like lactoylglutathione lyase family enzyme
MSLVTFKDLCIDVNDSRPAAEFWARTLGLELTGFDDSPDEFKLVGPTQQHTVWPNVVPEPHEVKNRVHVDVAAASLEPFSDLRRLSEPGQYRWTVFADPEDNEFCVFVVDDVPDYKLKAVVVDCADPEKTASWWQGVLDGTLGANAEKNWHWITDIDGVPFEGFDFVPVPEPKTVKNRVHWDVTLGAGVEVGDLEAAGATVLRVPDDEIRWTIMADPEGNEFCVFASD